jgi:hypothetical protein
VAASNLGTAYRHIINVKVLTTRNPASAGNKVGIHAYLALK